MTKRTTEQLIQHREEQNRKARLRLARAKDGRVMLVEETIENLYTLAPTLSVDEVRITEQTIVVLRETLSRLVAEASAT
jgi:hypothetical protein